MSFEGSEDFEDFEDFEGLEGLRAVSVSYNWVSECCTLWRRSEA